MQLTTTMRNEPLLQTRRADAWHKAVKQCMPACCPECGAVLADGRWVWQKRPGQAARVRCPACVRIRQRVPAGYVDLRGDYFAKHRAEIVNLIHNTEAFEKQRHPLERIMGITSMADRTRVTTTGTHLARRLGTALCRAFAGRRTLHYLPGEQVVQVQWQRFEPGRKAA